MFKFWFEKFLLRFSFLVAFIAFIGVFVYAYYVEINNPPLDTDIAPFKESVTPVRDNALLGNGDETPLSKPHVNSKEIQNWLNTSVSEALTFNNKDYQRVMRNVRPYFTANGFAQYQAYLESSNIIKTLETGSYRVGLFFDQNPYVSNGVNFQNIYRWSAQMPLSLSFKSLRDGQTANRKVNLSLQIRRVSNDISPSGVQIDVWQAKAAR